MSALPQKRTSHCTATNVRFVPKADISARGDIPPNRPPARFIGKTPLSTRAFSGQIPVSPDFDSGQCLKFDVRVELKMDVLRRALLCFSQCDCRGLCATPQQSI